MKTWMKTVAMGASIAMLIGAGGLWIKSWWFGDLV